MRFMLLRKADRRTEAGELPNQALLAAMGAYMEEMTKAGVVLAGEGLHASSKGARVKFSGGKPTVSDGPFSGRDLLAGFCIIQVASKQEAIDWVKRCPNPMLGDSEIEIRQMFECDDFGEEFTPELREQEARLRKTLEAQNKP